MQKKWVHCAICGAFGGTQGSIMQKLLWHWLLRKGQRVDTVHIQRQCSRCCSVDGKVGSHNCNIHQKQIQRHVKIIKMMINMLRGWLWAQLQNLLSWRNTGSYERIASSWLPSGVDNIITKKTPPKNNKKI